MTVELPEQACRGRLNWQRGIPADDGSMRHSTSAKRRETVRRVLGDRATRAKGLPGLWGEQQVRHGEGW